MVSEPSHPPSALYYPTSDERPTTITYTGTKWNPRKSKFTGYQTWRGSVADDMSRAGLKLEKYYQPPTYEALDLYYPTLAVQHPELRVRMFQEYLAPPARLAEG